ncbi:MAG: helix-turn-helix domain-containing protein [Acutalibacteraceae bacterium]
MNKRFGDVIRELRTKAGLTQAELARRLGISPSAVGMYEQGRREPDQTILAKLCDVLHTTSDKLLGIVQTEKKRRDINDLIDEFSGILSEEQALMFNGMPITAEDKQKIIEAIRIAAEVAVRQKNKPSQI